MKLAWTCLIKKKKNCCHLGVLRKEFVIQQLVVLEAGERVIEEGAPLSKASSGPGGDGQITNVRNKEN